MTPHGHFHWNELMTRNLEKTKAFLPRRPGMGVPGRADGAQRHLLAGG